MRLHVCIGGFLCARAKSGAKTDTSEMYLQASMSATTDAACIFVMIQHATPRFGNALHAPLERLAK